MHTFSVLVNDEAGVLARVAGLFASRGYNIHSLSVAPTMENGVSRITIVTQGDEQILEQINKQLNKLVDVIKVLDLKDVSFVDRELVLIKVHASVEHRAEILRIADIFRARVVDVTQRSYTLEVTGGENKCEAILNLLKPLGIIEIVRTGKVAITRGGKRLTEVQVSSRHAAEAKREEEELKE